MMKMEYENENVKLVFDAMDELYTELLKTKFNSFWEYVTFQDTFLKERKVKAHHYYLEITKDDKTISHGFTVVKSIAGYVYPEMAFTKIHGQYHAEGLQYIFNYLLIMLLKRHEDFIGGSSYIIREYNGCTKEYFEKNKMNFPIIASGETELEKIRGIRCVRV